MEIQPAWWRETQGGMQSLQCPSPISVSGPPQPTLFPSEAGGNKPLAPSQSTKVTSPAL